MGSFNKAIISGNLGKDAELRFTQNGKPLVTFSVAVSGGYGDNKTTDWWDVSMFGERGERIAQYLTKGANVIVEGRLQKRSWDDNGTKRYAVSIVAGDVVLQGGGKRDDGWGPPQQRPQQSAARNNPPPFGEEDDLPF